MDRLGFRPATEADIPLMARAGSKSVPHHPTNDAEMRLEWRISEGMGTLRYWIVSTASDELGYVGLLLVEGGEGHGYFEQHLPGADADLHAEVLDFAEAQGAELGITEAVAEVWADQHALLDGLGRRGWAERRRERFWRLELGPARERLVAEHAAWAGRVRAGGADIMPASALGGDSIYPQLFEIHNRSHEDIPRSVPFVPEPWQVWIDWMEEVATPDRVWVAVVDGKPAGYSYLAHYSGGRVETGYTGMLREHRGRGLARAMKLATLVQALEEGVEVVETDNDSENAPIIHLNQALGYEEITGKLELAKSLRGS